MLTTEMLEDIGCTVVGVASTVTEAKTLSVKLPIEIAVLDVNLNDEQVFPVARILRERGIPIIFATGYAAAGLPLEWAGATLLQKPYGAEELKSALQRAIARTQL